MMKFFYYMRFVIMLCLIGEGNTSQSLQTSPIEDVLLRDLSEQLDQPHVAFGLDFTVFHHVPESGRNCGLVQQRLPGAYVIPYFKQNGEVIQDHVFYPEYMEVFLTLMQWGWHIDLFSNYWEGRNNCILKAYFAMALRPYSQDVASDVNALFECHIRVASRPEAGRSSNDVRNQIDRCKNILFVDEAVEEKSEECANKSAVKINSQLLKSSSSFYRKKNQFRANFDSIFDFTRSSSYKEGAYPEQDFAAYVLGILAECRDIMDSDDEQNIHLALTQVLKIDHGKHGHRRVSHTAYITSAKDATMEQLNRWITKGRTLIALMKDKRSQSYMPPKNTYKEAALLMYGEAFVQKHMPDKDQ